MRRIIKSGFRVITKERSKYYLLFITLCPLLASIISAFADKSSVENISEELISGVAIFIGVQFSLIILVASKAKKHTKILSNNQSIEEIRIRAIDHLNFSKEIIVLMSFSVLVCITLICTIVAGMIHIDYGTNTINAFISKMNFCTVIFLSTFQLIITLDILKQMFSFFMIDLNVTEDTNGNKAKNEEEEEE